MLALVAHDRLGGPVVLPAHGWERDRRYPVRPHAGAGRQHVRCLRPVKAEPGQGVQHRCPLRLLVYLLQEESRRDLKRAEAECPLGQPLDLHVADRRIATSALIPFVVMAGLPVPLQKAIVASGWSMDSLENLIPLPANLASYVGLPNLRLLPQHSGSHIDYDADVRVALISIVTSATTNGGKPLRDALKAVEELQRSRLLQRVYHPRVH